MPDVQDGVNGEPAKPGWAGSWVVATVTMVIILITTAVSLNNSLGSYRALQATNFHEAAESLRVCGQQHVGHIDGTLRALTSGYAASKGAMNGLTREWALDLRKKSIRVNAIIPAECMTPLYEAWLATLDNAEATVDKINKTIPFENRMTTCEELAATTVFTASARSSHTTGQILYVDGGYTHLDRACTVR